MGYKDEIRYRLQDKPYLRPVYTNVYFIPERLRRIDPNLFVVFNRKTQWYEIHSLANKGDTFALLVPFSELDGRCEEHVKKFDLKRHGKQIFQHIEDQNEKKERAIQRERSNYARNLADELYKPVKRLAWWGE